MNSTKSNLTLSNSNKAFSFMGLLNSIKKRLCIEFVFLFVLFLFAIIVTRGYTIAWGLVPLFLVFPYAKNSTKLSSKKETTFLILLFLIVFAINFVLVYNFENQVFKLPHPDFHYYLKVASSFNETGVENNLTAKNDLFDNLKIATQYRFFDTWLLSLLLALLPFSDLTVLQLLYMPILYFMVSFAVFRNIDFVKNYWIKILLSVSFLFLFGDYLTNSIVFSSSYLGELCVVSYPKLAIFFGTFLYFFRSQFSATPHKDSILVLAFLPILIQVAFPLYIFIYIYMIINYDYFLKNKKILIAIILSTFYYVSFYAYNSYLFNQVFGLQQFQLVKSVPEYLHRFLSILYNLIKSKLLFFIIISLLFISFSDFKTKLIYFKVLFIAIGIQIPGALIYALFPLTPNSYQFLTNFTFPVFITIVFFFCMHKMKSIERKFYTFYCVAIFIFAFFGFYYQYYENSFFGFSTANEKRFEVKAQRMLKHVKNPIGITYWSEKFEKKFENRSHSEAFNQHGTNFLISLGGNYDVVCLTSLQNKNTSFAANLDKYYSAIGTYKRLNSIAIDSLQYKFYKNYNFEYLISDLTTQSLPVFIKKDVVDSVFDPKSEIYCYRLAPKSQNIPIKNNVKKN